MLAVNGTKPNTYTKSVLILPRAMCFVASVMNHEPKHRKNKRSVGKQVGAGNGFYHLKREREALIATNVMRMA